MSSQKLNLEGMPREFVDYVREAESRGLDTSEIVGESVQGTGKKDEKSPVSMNSTGTVDPGSFVHPEAVDNAYFAIRQSLAVTHPPSAPRGVTMGVDQGARALDGYRELLGEATDILLSVRELRRSVDEGSLKPYTEWIGSLQKAVDDMVDKVARYQRERLAPITGYQGAPTKYHQEQLAEFFSMQTELAQNLGEAMAHLGVMRALAQRRLA